MIVSVGAVVRVSVPAASKIGKSSINRCKPIHSYYEGFRCARINGRECAVRKKRPLLRNQQLKFILEFEKQDNIDNIDSSSKPDKPDNLGSRGARIQFLPKSERKPEHNTSVLFLENFYCTESWRIPFGRGSEHIL